MLLPVTVKAPVTAQSEPLPNLEFAIVVSPLTVLDKAVVAAAIASVTTFISAGCTANGQTLPVLVPAFTSACVANSTLPKVVVVAGGVAVPVSIDSRCAVVVL